MKRLSNEAQPGSPRLPRLRDIQVWVQANIKRPDPESALDLIREAPPLSRAERLEIYSCAYFERIFKSMIENFPEVYRRAGEERFRGLLCAYLERHPSRSWTLSDVGSEFPAFLSGIDDLQPSLAALARLEWHRCEAFRAADLPLHIRFALAPSVRLLETHWDLLKVDLLKDQSEGAFHFVTWRTRQYQVKSERVEECPFRILEWISRGEDLDGVCGLLLERGWEKEATSLKQWFEEWTASGVIASGVIA